MIDSKSPTAQGKSGGGDFLSLKIKGIVIFATKFSNLFLGLYVSVLHMKNILKLLTFGVRRGKNRQKTEFEHKIWVGNLNNHHHH